MQRLTGTQAVFDRNGIEGWLRTRKDYDDRADWAVLRASDGAFLGEAVINDLDPANGAAPATSTSPRSHHATLRPASSSQ